MNFKLCHSAPTCLLKVKVEKTLESPLTTFRPTLMVLLVLGFISQEQNTKVNMNSWNMGGAIKELWKHLFSGTSGLALEKHSSSVSTLLPGFLSLTMNHSPETFLSTSALHVVGEDHPLGLSWLPGTLLPGRLPYPPGLSLPAHILWTLAVLQTFPFRSSFGAFALLYTFFRNVFLSPLYPFVQNLLILSGSVPAPLSLQQPLLNSFSHLAYLPALPWCLMVIGLLCWSEHL